MAASSNNALVSTPQIPQSTPGIGNTIELITASNLVVNEITEECRDSLIRNITLDVDCPTLETCAMYSPDEVYEDAEPISINAPQNDAIDPGGNGDNLNTDSAMLDDIMYVLDNWKSVTKDKFVNNLMLHVKCDELAMQRVRLLLFEKSKVNPFFPTVGPRELKTRRSNRNSGESLVQKLAYDCYTLYIFLNGGDVREITDLLTATRRKQMPATPTTPTSPIIRQWLHEPPSDNEHIQAVGTHSDVSMIAELKLVKGIALQLAKDNKCFYERTDKLESELEKERQLRILEMANARNEYATHKQNLSKQVKTLSDDFAKLQLDCAELSVKCSPLQEKYDSRNVNVSRCMECLPTTPLQHQPCEAHGVVHEKVTELRTKQDSMSKNMKSLNDRFTSLSKGNKSSISDAMEHITTLRNEVSDAQKSMEAGLEEISRAKRKIDETSYLTSENSKSLSRLSDEKSFGVSQVKSRLKIIEESSKNHDCMPGDIGLPEMKTSIQANCDCITQVKSKIKQISDQLAKNEQPPDSRISIESIDKMCSVTSTRLDKLERKCASEKQMPNHCDCNKSCEQLISKFGSAMETATSKMASVICHTDLSILKPPIPSTNTHTDLRYPAGRVHTSTVISNDSARTNIVNSRPQQTDSLPRGIGPTPDRVIRNATTPHGICSAPKDTQTRPASNRDSGPTQKHDSVKSPPAKSKAPAHDNGDTISEKPDSSFPPHTVHSPKAITTLVSTNNREKPPDGFTGVIRNRIDRYYLTQVNASVTDQSIRDYLTDRDVTPTFVKFFRSKIAGAVSLRVNVVRPVGFELIDSGFWPEGVICRQWRSQAMHERHRQESHSYDNHSDYHNGHQ